MRITVVRHAESMGNAGLGGGVNPPLSPKGREQARRTGERLAREGVTHVWASPFRRAVETALAVAEPLGLGVVLHHRMCEHYIYDDFRGWRAPKGKAILRKHKGRRVKLAGDFPEGRWTPVWGESWDAICARTALVAMRALALGRRRAGKDTHLVIVGHGASVKAILRALTGLDIRQDEPYVNAGLSRVRVAKSLPVKPAFLNDTRHLKGL